jgi:hypothetical protein
VPCPRNQPGEANGLLGVWGNRDEHVINGPFAGEDNRWRVVAQMTL